MSEITINGLLQEAGPIKDATNDNENTALKVGNMFIHIIQYLLKYQNSIESGGGNSSDDLGQLTPINLGLILADLNDLNSYPENNDLVLVWNHTSDSGWDFLPYGGGGQGSGQLGTGEVTWQQLGRAPEPNTQQINLGHLDLSAYTKNTDSWWGNTPSTLENGTHVVTGSLQGGIQFIRFNRSVTSGGTTANYEVYLGLDENGDLRLSHTSEGNGTASFYATGGVSALGNSSSGSGSGSGSGGEGQSTPLNKLLTDLNSLNQSFGDSDKYYTIKKNSSSVWTLETNNLGNLNDVVYDGTPSSGQYLAFDGNNWKNVDASPNQSSGVNIISGTSALAWDTEKTLATINGTAIKAKLPLLPTDEKVKLDYVSNANYNYPILFSNTANLNSPATVTESVNRSDGKLYYNPSTQTLTVLNISGNATSATNDNANHKITDYYVHSITTSNNTLTYKDADGDLLGTANLVNSVSNTWTAGTTEGPTIQTTVNGVAGTAVAIPSAGASASGIVTTGAQTFAGSKTFSSKIIGNLQGNADTATSFQNKRILFGNDDWGNTNIGYTESGGTTYGSAASLKNVYRIYMIDEIYMRPSPDYKEYPVISLNTLNLYIGKGPATNSTDSTVETSKQNLSNKIITNLYGYGINLRSKGNDDIVMSLSNAGLTYLPLATTGPKSGNTYTGAGPAAGLRIGDAVLYWDEANQALALAKYNESAPNSPTTANFYATGGVSALGMSPGNGSSSVPAMTFGNLSVTDLITITDSNNEGGNSTIYQNSSGELCISPSELLYIDNDISFNGSNNKFNGNNIYMGEGQTSINGGNIYMGKGNIYAGGGNMYLSRGYIYLDDERYLFVTNDGTLKYHKPTGDVTIA